jgi:hypothetical protein
MSTLGKPFFSVLLTAAVARMVLSGYYQVGASAEWNRVASGFGIALAALVMHGGTALGLEDARHRELLPLFPRGGADQAFQVTKRSSSGSRASPECGSSYEEPGESFSRQERLRTVALPPLRPAAFFCAVVPPCKDEDFDEPELELLPPRLDEPDEFAIRAARCFDIPLSFRASYCFSFLTFELLFGITTSRVR